jgi:hypothetical protein
MAEKCQYQQVSQVQTARWLLAGGTCYRLEPETYRAGRVLSTIQADRRVAAALSRRSDQDQADMNYDCRCLRVLASSAALSAQKAGNSHKISIHGKIISSCSTPRRSGTVRDIRQSNRVLDRLVAEIGLDRAGIGAVVRAKGSQFGCPSVKASRFSAPGALMILKANIRLG